VLGAAPTNEGPQPGAGGEGDARNEEVTHLSRQSRGQSRPLGPPLAASLYGQRRARAVVGLYPIAEDKRIT
jgi:hypothetical protein